MLKNITITLITFICSLYAMAQKNYAQYVNPFIGTGGHGHTYPGATMPHGMVQLSPDTRLDGWDGCGGYHYSDSFIYGFTHTHLSGTGVSDYGDILLMPMNGAASPDNKIYGSSFNHKNEDATAGYYRVKLNDDNIEAEFTATERTGFHHYRFSSTINNNIILDLRHRDEVIESSLKIEDSITVSGLRRSKAWADNQYVFFVIKFSKSIKNSGIWNSELREPDSIHAIGKSTDLKAFFQFDLTDSKDIYVKVAISSVSVEGAKKNLAAELPDWDFEQVKKQGEKKWNTELSKVEVSGNDPEKIKIFYTALYHTAIVPNINMDVDGHYRGRDNQIHEAEGYTYYSVFSLWDTYRSAHPLYTITDRSRTLDYIQTFLTQYKEGGRLPVWELASCETDCMIGYHSVPVIYDAFQKGITGFDTRLALEAMEKSATRQVPGLQSYIKHGMIESSDEPESVSKTLEYSFDDWCIARFANSLGNRNAYLQYLKRAQYYRNLLDVKTGFMRPKNNGDWLSPFDPREVNNNYTEANSWQYSFYMPQDIGGYLKLTGGRKALEDKLDSLFATSSETTGRDQSDITGLIGQYAHGNEPSHHIIYLYDYTKSAFKTQQLVHKVMTEMYKNSPDGLIGNEDCGQMSAWYVLSALGFYPVTPGSGMYMIGTPQFSNAVIHLENGKTFTINAADVSDENFYIKSTSIITTTAPVMRSWNANYLNHADIAGGGVISFAMSDKPLSATLNNNPATAIKDNINNIVLITNPVIHGGAVPFKNSKLIPITAQKNTTIYYTLDASEPTVHSKKYKQPVQINNSATLKAIALDKNGNSSFVSTAEYKKLSHDWSVTLGTSYEQQYSAGGADGLIDETYGSTDWRKGNWQGYQHTDLNVVIDMKKVKYISQVSANFLQDTRAWIIMPKQLTIEVSLNGKDYVQAFIGENFLSIEDLNVQLKKVDATFPATPARYVRIIAEQYGKLPAWHEGAGGDSHIFIDEVEIK